MSQPSVTTQTEEKITFCRICEPHCGLIATLTEGRITAIKGDKEHPLSQGHLCVKSAAMVDVNYDKDRVTQPLKRAGGPGEFVAVSWETALSEIAERLERIQAKHGRASFATYLGNPAGYAYATTMWLSGFQDALGVKWRYGPNAEDTAARMAASAWLYGSCSIIPKPDLWRSRFALILGANPKVSHSSLFIEPKTMDALRQIRDKGGRVLIVDPRRTETAREFEHVGIRAGKDAFFLIGLIRTILSEELADTTYIARNVTGAGELGHMIQPFDVDRCARECGVPTETIRQIARDFAKAECGFVYGRVGTSTQRFGTLTSALIDIVMALTGNIEREGGAVFGWGPIDFEKFAEAGGFASYNKTPTRVYKHPEVFGLHPSTSLPVDILVPGDEQVHALMTIATNPVLSSAATGPQLIEALEALDLHFSLDLYVNETNKHADYILPVTTFFEREDIPVIALAGMLRPSIWMTPATVERRGQVREEWEILQEICRLMGKGGAYSSPILQRLAKWGVRPKPRHMIDLLLRTSESGDKFGLRPKGLSVRKLLKAGSHGVRLKDHVPITSVARRVKTADKRINVYPDFMPAELMRLSSDKPDPQFPLRMIGLREMKSINSWMHNSERLMAKKRGHFAVINPADASAAEIVDGGQVSIRSAVGTIVTTARVSDEVLEGHIAVPHGWGHAGGWSIANQAGGANSNLLASAGYADIEPIAGMSILNGVPVAISAYGEP